MLPERASISPSHLMHACTHALALSASPTPFEVLPRQARTQTHTRDVRTLPRTQMRIKAHFYTKSYSLEMDGMARNDNQHYAYLAAFGP